MTRQEMIRTFTLANDFKEGDLLVGGTRDDRERTEARAALSSMTVRDISRTVFVEDGITEVLARGLSFPRLDEIANLTIGHLKQILVSPAGPPWANTYQDALPSEVIAAVAKVMSNRELGLVCRSIFNPLPGKGVRIGSAGHFGSRVQPNSPGDDDEEILLSILEGLSYQCGDVIIGLNPASDDLDSIIRLEELLGSVVDRLRLPTRYSVLSDIVKQTGARARARVDVGFQSLGGTSKSLAGMVGLDADGLLDLARGFSGLYFETGQGSAVTNGVAEGVDMVTLESRAYGLARHLGRETGSWMIVNDVAGFIGPEVFRTSEQLKRACLEDTAMAKLHGLTMGLDVCATFHMGVEPASLRKVTREIVAEAAPVYLMAVAGNADPMLGYMTTAFRDHPQLRGETARQVSTAMCERLAVLGVASDKQDRRSGAEALYAAYMKSGGDTRSTSALSEEASRKYRRLQERGFDLGYGDREAEIQGTESRLDGIYTHARSALYALIDEAVLKDASGQFIRARTASSSREEYLARPSTGESISSEDAARLRAIYSSHRPRLQIVISDGLNANAINENLRPMLPLLKRRLAEAGLGASGADIVISNGRVRAGYHLGELTGTQVVIHLIGERPGTGMNMMSAYVTYGLDQAGAYRWSRGLDHSSTTAVCGIHRLGKPPEAAANEVVLCALRAIERQGSGVAIEKP